MIAIATAELKMMLRNRLVALSAILLPLAFGVYFVFFAEVGEAVALTAGMVAALTMATAGYVATTTTLAVRRETSMIKRLRSGAVSDGAILLGLTAPLTWISLIQAGLIMVGLTISSGSVPRSPLLLVVAATLLIAMLLGAAFVTSRFTRSAEQAQMTTLPVFMVVMGGVAWASLTDPGEFGPLRLVAPGGAFAELVRIGWNGGDLPSTVTALAVAVAWALVAGVAARRLFQWDRRS